MSASTTDFREILFLLSGILNAHFVPVLTIVPWMLRIWDSFFFLGCFLPFTPSPHLEHPTFIKAKGEKEVAVLSWRW